MRVKLVVLTGATVGHEVEVQGSITIGRTSQCGLSLPVVTVSREHAKVFAKDGSYHVVDLNSSNGTRVNGRGVTRHQLADGDEIQCGDQTLRFVLLPEGLASGVRGGPARDARVLDERTPDALVLDELAPEELAPEELASKEPVSEAGQARTVELPMRIEPRRIEPEISVRAPSDAGAPRAPAMGSGSEAVAVQSRDRVLQFHRVQDRRGLLAEDLSQRGGLGRWLILVGVVALAVSVFWVAKNHATGKPPEEPRQDEPNEENR
jgi:predicted component of type VI protein secretion system